MRRKKCQSLVHNQEPGAGTPGNGRAGSLALGAWPRASGDGACAGAGLSRATPCPARDPVTSSTLRLPAAVCTSPSAVIQVSARTCGQRGAPALGGTPVSALGTTHICANPS